MITPNPKQNVHFKGLNGIRAIAALGVVFFHITYQLDAYGLSSVFDNRKTVLEADYWVSVFFALSGFLITYLLLAEKERQKIDIKKFYFRRALRIWPLYFLYLALSVGAVFIFHFDYRFSYLPFYFFFMPNVAYLMGQALPTAGHYWSLGVEEQFYLAWPWIVRKSKHLKTLCISLILIFITAKVAARYSPGGYNSLAYGVLNLTRYHCMLIGALGAIFYYERSPLFIRLTTAKASQAVAWCCIVLMAANRFNVMSALDNELVSGITVVLIMGQITVKNRLINLENRICDFLGKISFGIYVIHALILFLAPKIIGNLEMPVISKLILIYTSIVFSSILLAYLSYKYIEMPFLRLKKKYSVIHSTPEIADEENAAPPARPAQLTDALHNA